MKNIHLLLSSYLCLAMIAWASAQRPNFLVIVSDDQSYEAIGITSTDGLRTSHLDHLASRGIRFTHAFNMGGWHGAVCVASRAMLMSGYSLWRAEALMRPRSTDNDPANANHDQVRRPKLWPELMAAAGYETYMAGKWHLQGLAPADTAFHHTQNIRPGMPRDTLESYGRPRSDNRWTPWDHGGQGYWQGGKHWSEVLADDGVEFLNRAANSEKPFFIYLAFNAPHDPRQSPQEFVRQYPRQSIDVPADFLPEYPYKQEMGCYKQGREGAQHVLRDERLAPWPRTPEAVRLHRQEYYAIITHMDEQIGRVLEQLRQTGQSDNTYIIFTSDHGLACGHHGLLGKQNMYDHSMRVPLILSGPDIPAGKQENALVYLQDIMPTTLALAGIDIPGSVDFESLLGFYDAREHRPADRTIYGCYQKDLQRMVRDNRYKLIVYPQVPTLRLFDVQNDPLETRDLASAQPDVVRDMFEKLQSSQRRMQDRLELSADQFGI